MGRKTGGFKKEGGHHPKINVVKPPTGLCAGIHLGKNMNTHIVEDPKTGQMKEKKWDSWPEKNKDVEELPYIND